MSIHGLTFVNCNSKNAGLQSDLDKPKLVVAVVVDQMRFDNLDKYKVRYRSFEFCGTWGDPVMNRELLGMVQYIIDNSNATISIDTNGSIRDEEWWWNLGIIGGRRLHATFAVDGIDQKMHSHYRRNTDLKKVLANMESISQTRSKQPQIVTLLQKYILVKQLYQHDITIMIFVQKPKKMPNIFDTIV